MTKPNRANLILAVCCLVFCMTFVSCSPNQRTIEAAKSKIAGGLINPDSAQFSNVNRVNECVQGFVDGKNKMGSMAGPVAFVYLHRTEETWISDSENTNVDFNCSDIDSKNETLSEAYDRKLLDKIDEANAKLEEAKKSWIEKTTEPDPIDGSTEVQLLHIAENLDNSNRQHILGVYCGNDSRIGIAIRGFSVSDKYDHDSYKSQIKIGSKEPEDAVVVMSDDGNVYFILGAFNTGKKLIDGLSSGEDIVLRLRSKYGATVRTVKFYGEKFPPLYSKFPDSCEFKKSK